MRKLRTVLLGVATIGLIGAVAYAADAPQTHVLTIPLPGGGVEQIRYSGNVAPTVMFRQGSPAAAAWANPFGAGSPFAMLDRIQAEMDRQMAAMLQHRMIMPTMPQIRGGPLQQVTAGAPPAGAQQSYSMVSTFSGGHACTESVEVTSQGAGQPPKVVRQSSGDCGAAARAAPAAPAAAIPPGRRTSI
ncbi:MAG TPA: hypothetical protein VN805_07975 [Caulobacteraceae bacterium]|nr:hypothetical protein [Caulobacteraceae bacterium]